MEKLTNIETFIEKIERDSVRTIALFRAEWCGDCHYIDSFMDALSQKYAEDIDTLVIDIEEFPDLSRKLSVVGIPSFVAFDKGEEIDRFVNRQRKTESEIDAFYQSVLLKKAGGN